MHSFNAAEPPTHKHAHHIHTVSSSSSHFLNRPYTTLRRIWSEHRHKRRFLLSFLCILLPTLLTAVYFAGGHRRGAGGEDGGVAMKDPLAFPPNAQVSGHTPIKAGAEGQKQGKGQRWSGSLHGGRLKRRAGVVPRQASSSSIDNADVPVLSLSGLGNTQSSSASSASSTSLPPNSNSVSATPTPTLLSTVAPSVPSSPILLNLLYSISSLLRGMFLADIRMADFSLRAIAKRIFNPTQTGCANCCQILRECKSPVVPYAPHNEFEYEGLGWHYALPQTFLSPDPELSSDVAGWIAGKRARRVAYMLRYEQSKFSRIPDCSKGTRTSSRIVTAYSEEFDYRNGGE